MKRSRENDKAAKAEAKLLKHAKKIAENKIKIQNKLEKQKLRDQTKEEIEAKKTEKLLLLEIKRKEKELIQQQKDEILMEKQKKEMIKQRCLEKEKNIMKSFFSKSVKRLSTANHIDKNHFCLREFPTKNNVKIAPIFRKEFNAKNKQNFDQLFSSQNTKIDIKNIRKTNYQSTYTSSPKKCITVIDENSQAYIEKLVPKKFKYLKFYENRKPPFYKQFNIITNMGFDYTIDSDDEWEDEPGDDCNSGDESDKSFLGNSQDEDGFIVPHGYLSDDEKKGVIDYNEERPFKNVGQGIKWNDGIEENFPVRDPNYHGVVLDNSCKSLLHFKMRVLTKNKIMCSLEQPVNQKKNSNVTKPPVLVEFSQIVIKELVNIIHGNAGPLNKMIQDFIYHCSTQIGKHCGMESDDYMCASKTSKRQLEYKIKSIASYDRSLHAWIMKPHAVDKYKLKVKEITFTPKIKDRFERLSVIPSLENAMGGDTDDSFGEPLTVITSSYTDINRKTIPQPNFNWIQNNNVSEYKHRDLDIDYSD
ncbi:hypothetical protein A3Q56_01994 [Intoshia linei]|uniref:Chromatin assembly factor 1 subunit A n=1 Tax=Intoshia linei TaxID=1819745 RepID=A0A177B9I6_9BILA|nr:hypothetical protein A3Q56_01994 [Intoshia linei]